MATEIEPQWRDKCRYDVPLAECTAWRIGGLADVVFEPESRSDLSMFLARLDASIPVWWLGAGSNVLVRDGGLRGVVIRTAPGLNEIVREGEAGVVAEAGVRLCDLVAWTHQQGLVGVEFLGGIPGTVGGATRMNAGAYGHSIWEHIHDVELIDRWGEFRWVEASQIPVAYRRVELPPGMTVTRVSLQLTHGAVDEARSQLAEWNATRRQRQPLEWPSCGSVFKNPPGDYAGRLIEAAGLKGLRVGGVEVSGKSANFLINTGAATAADAEALIAQVQAAVLSRFGVSLETEVIILGDSRVEKEV